MKTNNDYLAEYVREKRPEIEESLAFMIWKATAVLREAISGLAKSMNKVADQGSKLFADDSCDEECDESDTEEWIGGELGHTSKCGHEGCSSDIWNGCKNFYCPNCGRKVIWR